MRPITAPPASFRIEMTNPEAKGNSQTERPDHEGHANATAPPAGVAGFRDDRRDIGADQEGQRSGRC
jgi:hypothetical protein